MYATEPEKISLLFRILWFFTYIIFAAEVRHVFLLSENTGQPGTSSPRDQSTTYTVALTQEIVVAQMMTETKRQKRKLV